MKKFPEEKREGEKEMAKSMIGKDSSMPCRKDMRKRAAIRKLRKKMKY